MISSHPQYQQNKNEPYFPTVFGTFTIKQNYEHCNLVNVTADFGFKRGGYVPQFQHSANGYDEAMLLVGKDIHSWANQRK